MTSLNSSQGVFLTPASLLSHWQGHRRLTRRLIEAFPEDQLFTFAVGGMRPFGVMAVELLRMAAPTVEGVATNNWPDSGKLDITSRGEILRLWDESTARMNESWSQIPPERFQETMTAFGQWEGKVHDLVMYAVDNEIHHRAQGYVYLRALNVEPPPFWERE